MKEAEVVSTPQEIPQEFKVEKPVFSMTAGEKFRLDLSKTGAEAVVLIAGATAVCCICGGSNAAIRLGIVIVDKLLK